MPPIKCLQTCIKVRIIIVSPELSLIHPHIGTCIIIVNDNMQHTCVLYIIVIIIVVATMVTRTSWFSTRPVTSFQTCPLTVSYQSIAGIAGIRCH